MRDDMGMGASAVADDEYVASRIESAQDRRRFVIDEVIPLLREHGETSMTDVANMLGKSVVEIAAAIKDARRYVTVCDKMSMTSCGQLVGRASTRLYLSVNKALI